MRSIALLILLSFSITLLASCVQSDEEYFRQLEREGFSQEQKNRQSLRSSYGLDEFQREQEEAGRERWRFGEALPHACESRTGIFYQTSSFQQPPGWTWTQGPERGTAVPPEARPARPRRDAGARARGDAWRISGLFIGAEDKFKRCQHLGYPSRKSVVDMSAVPKLGL